MPLRPLIAGNWKMYGRRSDLAELAAIAAFVGQADGAVETAIFPPFTLLADAVRGAGAVAIGAQDCRAGGDGAFTGDVNAAMIADLGARFVLLGHSERRQGWGETDAAVKEKATAARAAGLTAVVCVGETLAQRQAGEAAAVVAGQIKGSLPDSADAATLVIAYEPVWAIGTGLTPSAAEIGEIHAVAKAALPDGVRVLYGGSVKPGNAGEIFSIAGVDGALVGGASLKAADFTAILAAHPAWPTK
jgi:triosephosphate isomerase